uniref:hypothetical protein n=1 Tax=Bacillus pumilus TaxID=1408 RepID=UPI001C9314B5
TDYCYYPYYTKKLVDFVYKLKTPQMRGFLFCYHHFKRTKITLPILLPASLPQNLSLSNFSNFQGKFMGDHAYTETEMNLI